MLDYENDPVVGISKERSKGLSKDRYSMYVEARFYRSAGATAGSSSDLYSLMNGLIKKKLKIIPRNVT